MGNLSKDSEISPLFHSLTPSARPGRAHVAGLHRLFQRNCVGCKGTRKGWGESSSDRGTQSSRGKESTAASQINGRAPQTHRGPEDRCFCSFFFATRLVCPLLLRCPRFLLALAFPPGREQRELQPKGYSAKSTRQHPCGAELQRGSTSQPCRSVPLSLVQPKPTQGLRSSPGFTIQTRGIQQQVALASVAPRKKSHYGNQAHVSSL